ncbi:MAG: FtsB family cell division protein [Candidatus Aquicultorales bacterium]
MPSERRRKKNPGNVVRVDFRRAWGRYRVLIYVAGGLLIAFWAVYPVVDRAEQSRKIERLERKIQSLEEQNVAAEKEIARLSTDEYVEEIARRDLGLAKPDEEVYVVYGAEETESPAPAKKPPQEDEPSWWRRVLELIGL